MVQKDQQGTKSNEWNFQRAIGTTSFELLFGVKLREAEDIHLRELVEEETIERFNDNRRENREKARQQIQKMQEENMKSYNKKRKEAQKYEIGDLVAIKRTQMRPGLKVDKKFLGPYRIIKVNRNDRYAVEKADEAAEGPLKTSTSADCMKPWTGFIGDLEESDEDQEEDPYDEPAID